MAKILIVDDRQPNRQFMVTLLGYGQHRVFEAADGLEALRIARAERPDLIVSDILMPTMDGYEFVRQLRNEPTIGNTPVIFTAHFLSREAESLAKACGVSAVIYKPCDPETVLRIVDEAVSGKQLPEGPAAAAEDFDREHLQLLTNQLSRKANDLKTANLKLNAIFELSQQLAHERDPLRLLEKHSEIAREIIGAKWAAIGVLDDKNETLAHFHAIGLDEDAAATIWRALPDSGIVTQVVKELRAHRIAERDAESRLALTQKGIPVLSSFMILPLAFQSRLYGWLCLADKLGAGEFGDEDERLATAMAAQVAVAYENASLLRRAEDQTAELQREIGERRRAEDSQREINQTLETVIQTLPLAFVILDRDQRVKRWNRGATRMFGWTEEEVLDRPYPIVPADQRGEFEVLFQNDLAGRNQNGSEVRRRRKDGVDIEVAVWGSRVRNASGETGGTMLMLADITERKQAERDLGEGRSQLASIIGSAMDAIITVDDAQRITLFNAAAEKMFECSVEDAAGQPLDRFIPERFRDAHQQHIRKFGRTHVTSRAMGALGAITGLTAAGREFPIEASISQVEITGQKLYTVILRDITERKQAEEQVRGLTADLEQRVAQRTAELQVVNKELEAFSYSVSHDLRAPLRHINGFSQALLEDYEDKLDDAGKGYLHQVRGASQEMAQLIDDVLQLARVTRTEMHRESINLSEMARKVITDLRKSDEDRSVVIEIEEGLATQGDKRLMQIMLINLLGNAWKFTSKQEQAEIAFGQAKQDGTSVYFVRDNGAGFEMTYAGKLFRAFQRLHTAGEFEGTGIGLATVQRVVNRHGGRVWAEGKLNEGATFYFTLPDFKELDNGDQSDPVG